MWLHLNLLCKEKLRESLMELERSNLSGFQVTRKGICFGKFNGCPFLYSTVSLFLQFFKKEGKGRGAGIGSGEPTVTYKNKLFKRLKGFYNVLYSWPRHMDDCFVFLGREVEDRRWNIVGFFPFPPLWKTCQKGREEWGGLCPLESKPKNITPCKVIIFWKTFFGQWYWNAPLFFLTRRWNDTITSKYVWIIQLKHEHVLKLRTAFFCHIWSHSSLSYRFMDMEL